MRNPKALTIKELFSAGHYVVPRYQRNYAWGEPEIDQLIKDVHDSSMDGNKDYYIGTLVVDVRDAQAQRFEVIDGQQRHTTLLILISVLKERCRQILSKVQEDELSCQVKEIQPLLGSLRVNLEYDFRERAQRTLVTLFNEGMLPQDRESSIENAWQICSRLLGQIVKESTVPQFTRTLLDHVKIVRNPVPEQTDVSHYFEIMNSRGQQLEKHEVLKVRLMARFKESDKAGRDVFALVWDACADMNRHVQYAMHSSFRKALFEGDLQRIPTDFEQLRRAFESSHKEPDSKDQGEAALSFLDCLKAGEADLAKTQSEDHPERKEHFGSVINFPNFLLQVLRIHCLEGLEPTDVFLDDKKLLDVFKERLFTEDDCGEKVETFLLLLLELRMLLDRYVVKPERDESDWSLKSLHWSKDGLEYQATFNTAEQKHFTHIIHLLAMFHVTFPSQGDKHWLTGILIHLRKKASEGIDGASYLRFLEEYDSHLFFGHFSSPGLEYRELAIQPLTKHPDLDCTRLHQGTLVHNHAFNRLEYLIWKVNQSGVEAGALKLDSEITKQFRFAFRSSVEHHFPRRPDSDMDLEWANQGMLKNGLHDFGNLCLISHQTNSSLNNALPEDKRRKVLKSKTIESLKQRLMIQAKAWGETEEGIDEICNHREAVIALLKQRTECVGC